MLAFSDCLWRGNLMFIDCDLFRKSWFPYYKHLLILRDLTVSLHKLFSFVYSFSSVSIWPCWIKMVFMPFFRAFKVSWSWIFYPSVCAFHYTSTIARGEQKLNTCVINNRFDMKKVKGTDRLDVCFLLKVIIHKSRKTQLNLFLFSLIKF